MNAQHQQHEQYQQHQQNQQHPRDSQHRPSSRATAGRDPTPTTAAAAGGSGGLCEYDRATVALWEHSYRALRTGTDSADRRERQAVPLPACLATAAVHALLAGLRQCTGTAALFAAYEDGPAAAADFAVIDSVVPPACTDPADPLRQNDERRWLVRDAAFHIRWLEVTATPM